MVLHKEELKNICSLWKTWLGEQVIDLVIELVTFLLVNKDQTVVELCGSHHMIWHSMRIQDLHLTKQHSWVDPNLFTLIKTHLVQEV